MSSNSCEPLTFSETKRKPRLLILGKEIKTKDLPYFISSGGALIYFCAKDPLVVATLGVTAIPLISFWQISQAIPFFKKYGIKIHLGQIITLITALVMVFSLFDSPAHAFFLTGLEDFVTDLVNSSQTGAGSTIDADAVSLFFNFIRAIFLIGVVIAALFAYGQAQQGNDWRPIGTQIGLAFGFVIAIDIITYIFTG